MTQLIKLFLDKCLKYKDAECIRKIMIMSLTYFKLEEENKVYLQALIKDHPVWKLKDFWEACLFEMIHEELK